MVGGVDSALCQMATFVQFRRILLVRLSRDCYRIFMEAYHLLKVEERYEPRPGRLLLFPDFPGETRSKLIDGTSCAAKAIDPEGAEFACEVTFFLAHYNIRHCVDKSRLYRFVTELTGISKAELPIGSDVFIEDKEVAFALSLDRRAIRQ